MKMQQAKLSFSEAGTPQSDAFGDVYFSKDDGIAESEYVFLQGNRLLEQWQQCESSHFCIAETGFGTGLNFLLTCRLFEAFLSKYPEARLKHLHYISFEKFPIPVLQLTEIHQAWQSLEVYSDALLQQYPLALEGMHRSYYQLATQKHALSLDLVFADAQNGMTQVHNINNGLVNAWYLDGFAPSKNESMWDDAVYQQMARLSAQNASLATFTAAGAVKRGLQTVGFEIKKIKGYGRKREMITAQFIKHAKTAHNPSVNTQAPYFRRDTLKKAPKHVAIVGAGIAGALLAMRLVEHGIKVSLICQDPGPAGAASGNPVGGFYPQLNAEASVNSQFFVHAFLYARRFYDELLANNVDFAHAWCGVLQLGFNPNTQSRLNKIAQRELWPDELAEVIDAKTASQKAGIDIPHPALWLPQAGWIAPISLVEACLEHAQQSELFSSYYDHQLLSYEKNEDGLNLVLQGSHTHLNADVMILATGASTPQIIKQNVPMRLTRGQVEAVPAQLASQDLRTVICHKGYFTPAVNGHHALGSTYVKNDLDTKHRAIELSQNLDMHNMAVGQTTWMQALNELNAENIKGRASIRCSTPDHLPLMGEMPNIAAQSCELNDLYKALPLSRYAQGSKEDGVYLLSGLGSRGITSAPLLVDTLVAQLIGKPFPMGNKLLDALSPNRFLVRALIRQQPYLAD
jgi:tRNA 5-methylaminomethyl-2-thiouridine biosynthesis bifunctional protein